MSLSCQTVDDPLAQALCRYLDLRDQLETGDVDTGWEVTRFVETPQGSRPVRERVGIDSFVGAPEIYERILRTDPQWIDPGAIGDERLRTLLSPQIEGIRSVLSRSGLRPGSFPYHLEMGRRLFAALTRPRSLGGFGLSFDTSEGPPRTPTAVFRDHRATCLDFVNFFMVAAEMAGIPAVPLELLQKERQSEMHVAIGFFDPSTDRLHMVVDLQSPHRLGPPRHGDVWSEISRRELLAYYYNARGIRNVDARDGETDIDFGLRLSPGNYLLLFNKAYFALNRGDLGEARRCLLEAIEANPNYSPSYYNLNAVALRLYDDELAQWSWDQYRRGIGRRD